MSKTVLQINTLGSRNETRVGWLSREPVSPNGNPVLTAPDVTDYGAVSFVADPFVYIDDDVWHLFFEVQNGQRDPNAVIGHATSTNRGASWEYDRIVLNYECHLAFPYIFNCENDIYMVPGQGGNPAERDITLFRATNFPWGWKPIVNLVEPKYGPLDPVVFQHNNRWWIIVGGGNNDTLYAYYSNSLESSKWTPHDDNPIVTDRIKAGRPAGRPYTGQGGPILYLQDNKTQYGDKVRAYRITELTPEDYSDEPVNEKPMLAGQGGLGWNSGRMHHIDVQKVGEDWVCVVDGDVEVGRTFSGSCWSIGIYNLDGPPIK